MKEKNRWVVKVFSVVVLVILLMTLGLATKYSAFIPSSMFMGSLLLFSISYYIMDDKEKKGILYTLFILGVLLIIGAISYTIMRLI